jgi:hypothetical protein
MDCWRKRCVCYTYLRWSEKDLEDALQAAHLGCLPALPFACLGDALLPYSAGHSCAVICHVDDVTAVASKGQLVSRAILTAVYSLRPVA